MCSLAFDRAAAFPRWDFFRLRIRTSAKPCWVADVIPSVTFTFIFHFICCHVLQVNVPVAPGDYLVLGLLEARPLQGLLRLVWKGEEEQRKIGGHLRPKQWCVSGGLLQFL